MNLDSCPYPPTPHQLVGIHKITTEPSVFLADDMGTGKSKTIIDSASVLYSQGVIDRVIVVAPARVKAVWLDETLGQLALHAWPTLSNHVTHFHSRREMWHTGDLRSNIRGTGNDPELEWIITNYAYIRIGVQARSQRIPPILEELLTFCTERTLLVLDESSKVKSTTTQQSRACLWLSKRCGRRVLLNGTPIAHSPLDLLSQGNILDPAILSDVPGTYCNLYQFRSRYCTMGGFQNKKEIAYRNVEELQARFKPYTLRREKSECLDLPPKLASVPLTCPLSPATWKAYTEMRRHMLVELQSGEVSVARQAVVKLIRLSQLCSGFLGGINGSEVSILGEEKVKLLEEWVAEQLDLVPSFKLVVWSQFRHDVERVHTLMQRLGVPCGRLMGQTSQQERKATLELLHPTTAPAGPAVVVGTPQSGSMGITLAAASTAVYLNNTHSLHIRMQSEDRLHRPGQEQAVSYFDVLATGPKGQQTIDHLVLKAIKSKKTLADWTASAWVTALKAQPTT